MSFTQRLIEIAIGLSSSPATGQTDAFNGNSQVTLSGHRVSAEISNAGSASGSACHLSIFGMKLSLMNQLATLGMRTQLVPFNTITITAGDADNGLSTVFGGTIISAYADFNGVPDVPFHIDAKTGLDAQVRPVPVSSYKGPTDVATIMASLAAQMGKGFEGNGVSQQIPSPYLSGSVWDQIQKVKQTANINADLVDGNTVLAIWPKNGSRGGSAPTITPPPDGQMIGYPAYTAEGIIVRTLFDPQISFGGQVNVANSTLPKVNGTWNVRRLDQRLDSLVPGGKWESIVYCYDPKFPNPVVPLK